MGNFLIADEFNNRAIRVNAGGQIVAGYGLPLAGADVIGNNSGYGVNSAQGGLHGPYDAKVVGDDTGLTPPFRQGRDHGGDRDSDRDGLKRRR